MDFNERRDDARRVPVKRDARKSVRRIRGRKGRSQRDTSAVARFSPIARIVLRRGIEPWI